MAEQSVELITVLDKLIRANLQLVTVARSVAAQSEAHSAQITQAREGLLKETKTLSSDKKAALSTTNHNYVKSLVNRTASLSPQSSYLCSLCKTVAVDVSTANMFKSVGTAITTLRDSLYLMCDTLASMPADWQDPYSEVEYYGVAKDVEKCLTVLLQAKAVAIGENVISRGNVAQITAAACAAVSATQKLRYYYSDPRKKSAEVVRIIKTSATAVAQMVAATNDSIAKSDLGISHGLVKASLVDGANAVKLGLEAVVQQVSEVSGRQVTPAYSARMEEGVARVHQEIVHLLACVKMLGEVSMSEVKNNAVTPQKIDLEKVQKTVKRATPAAPAVKPDTEKEIEALDSFRVNIWDEPEDSEDNIVFSEEQRMKAGTLNKIIEQMTSPDARGMKLLKTFVTTYRSLLTAEALFDKLMERFDVPEEHARNRTAIQARVCNVISHWVKHQFDDFSDELVQRIRAFGERLAAEALLPEGVSRNIIGIIDRQVKKKQATSKDSGITAESLVMEPQIPLTPARILFVFNEEEIAKQLTIIDFKYYQTIRPTEFLDLAWSKPKLKWRARNVSALIERSNSITLWVCSLIVWQKTLKERTKVLTKIVAIAQHLAALKNFNSLVGFISALNNAAVHRLKHTFAALSPESVQALEDLKKLTSVSQSYAAYRNEINTANPPCIPFLGVHLTDLTFIEEGNSKFVNDTLINVTKQEFVHNSIETIKKHQTVKYDFKYTEQLGAFLQELPHNNEDDLYQLSLYREARGADIKDIT